MAWGGNHCQAARARHRAASFLRVILLKLLLFFLKAKYMTVID